MPHLPYTTQPTPETLHVLAWLSDDRTIRDECYRLANQAPSALAAAELLERIVRSRYLDPALCDSSRGLAQDLLMTAVRRVDWMRVAAQYRVAL